MNADFILLNGRIATMDTAETACTALAALHRRIVALGGGDSMRYHIDPATRVLNAEGNCVIPGIVDSHAHPDAYAIRLRGWTPVSPDRARARRIARHHPYALRGAHHRERARRAAYSAPHRRRHPIRFRR